MTDIKMSEVFENLPTTPEKFWLSSDPEIRQKQMQALVHAINQHDKLAAENEKLLCLLQRLADTASECDGWESFPSPILDEAYEALNRT